MNGGNQLLISTIMFKIGQNDSFEIELRKIQK